MFKSGFHFSVSLFANAGERWPDCLYENAAFWLDLLSKNSGWWFIYEITDVDESVVYVGMSQQPSERLHEHIQCAKTDDRPFYEWLRRRLASGSGITMTLLGGSFREDEARRMEAERIAIYMRNGEPILNIQNRRGLALAGGH